MAISVFIRERGENTFLLRLSVSGRAPAYKTIHGTAADAQRAKEEWLARARSALPKLLKARPSMPLGDWLDRLIAANPKLTTYSRQTYRNLLNWWIDPLRTQPPAVRDDRHRPWTLGRLQLGKLTPEDGGKFIPAVLDAATARALDSAHPRRARPENRAASLRQALRLVRWSLKEAVRYGVMPVNPFEDVKLPAASRRDIAVPGVADLQKIQHVENDRNRLLLTLAAYTGARRGELLALRWRNISFEDRTISIEHSLEQDAGDPVPRLKEPKTKAGKRTIAIGIEALGELRAAKLAANAYAVENQRRIDDLPVLHRGDGEFWPPLLASHTAVKCMRQHDIPGSLHGLRHAHASILLGQGRMPAHLIKHRLGHTRVSTTFDLYAHRMDGDGQAAADMLDQIMRAPARRGARSV